MATERVTIQVSDGSEMGGYLATPEGPGPHPSVIVWMEIFGVNAHIRDVTERVAAEGYVALAPDFFHRSAPGLELGYDEDGFTEGIKHMTALVSEQMADDAQSAVAYLRGRGDTTDKVGVMGFCIGGHMTYLTAAETDVAAAVSFYGGGISAPQGPGGGPSTVSRTPKISGRIVCLYGAKDEHIPLDQVDAVRSALQAAGTDHEVVVYEDADHGFFCNMRDSYHESSAADAWTRVKATFNEHLRG